MTNDWPVLSIVTFLPLAGCFFIMLTRGEDEAVGKSCRYLALWTTIPTLIVSLLIWVNFDRSRSGFQMLEQASWISNIGIKYQLGIDGISMCLIICTALLTPICIFATWKSIKSRVREHMVVLLVLETTIIGSLCALDIFLFACFVIAASIPLHLMVGMWKKNIRYHAFFNFSTNIFLMFIPLLGAVLFIYGSKSTTDLIILNNATFSKNSQIWLFIAFFIPFMTMITLFPFHKRILDQQGNGEIGTLIMLTCISSKIGVYGFLRFSIPLFPAATNIFAPYMLVFTIVIAVYALIILMIYKSFKSFVLFALILQMGLIIIGVFSLTEHGIRGGIFAMLSHSFVGAGIIICMKIFSERLKPEPRHLMNGGIPIFLIIHVFILLAVIGSPGTGSFIGNLSIILGVIEDSFFTLITVFTLLVLLLTCVVCVYKRVLLGKVLSHNKINMRDLSLRDLGVLSPLIGLILWMGIYPMPFLDVILTSVSSITNDLKMLPIN
jgi:NADH-quinone oxidoreductase subunit M